MNHDEMVDLLTLISVRDNRTVGHATIAVWLEDIGDLSFTDARQAVAEHFREEPGVWLMAGHVRRRVKAARTERIKTAGVIAEHKAMHGRDVGDEATYRAELRRIHAEIGDAEQPPPFRAIEAGRAEATKPGDSSSYRRVREAWDAEQRAKRAAEKTARQARIAEEEAHRAAKKRATDAYGLLLVLKPEAQAEAYRQARAELGEDADKDEVTIRAAQLADHSKVADVESAESIRSSMARRGCRNGCPIGRHMPPCRWASKADKAAEEAEKAEDAS